MSERYTTELTVDIRADDPQEAMRLRYKVEDALMGIQRKQSKAGAVRWFCSKPVDKVPEKTAG